MATKFDRLRNYLEETARKLEGCEIGEFYLWPNTPVENLQAEIWRRVGVSDHMVGNPTSRSFRVVKLIEELLDNSLLSVPFSVLDICCGDAVVLGCVKARFPSSHCFGVDLLTETAPEGVHLCRAAIQHLFAADPEEPFDIVLMLNTYRGWDSARLRPHERNLPEQADAWFRRNARYAVLTATEWQIHHLRRHGFWTVDLGRGEDDSRLICMFVGQNVA